MSRALALAFAAALPALAQAPAGPFDASRDVAKDFEAAKVEAKRTHKRILLDVGGNWCSWCRLMDRFYGEQKDLRELRDRHFVTLLVNYSPEQKNEAFLGQFPKVKGYPHFFVLDADGKLLHSQDTGVLEDGKGYSREKMAAFLKAWKG